MLPVGTARSTPLTAGLPSNDLKRPLASIAKPESTWLGPPPIQANVLPAADGRWQAKPAPGFGGESEEPRLLRVRDRARERSPAKRRAAAGMARHRRAWRHDLDGGDGRAPRQSARALAGREKRRLPWHELCAVDR